MIITRTPLRISLGGGGTDIPSYYEQSGHGFLVTAAITKYIYVSFHENFEDDIILKYSKIERIRTVGEIEHPLIRECLRATGDWHGIEISSLADIPAGTGLGSSGAFAVGLLKALRTGAHSDGGNVAIAEEACRIEMERLGDPVGKQDQFIAAVGGVMAMTFAPDGQTKVERVDLASETRSRLEENILLFYTGVRRSALEVLAQEQMSTTTADLLENLDLTRDVGYRTRTALEDGELDRFGSLLTEQWELKYRRQPTAVHDHVDALIRSGIDAGALGGKLVGAGGGGFLLFYAEEKTGLRRAMSDAGLSEVEFQFDYLGSTVIVAR